MSGESTLQPPGQARGQPPGNHWGQRRIDKAFCLTITSAAMATAFPVSFVHAPWVRDLCVALSLAATGAVLARELWIGNGRPRLIFVLADGLALALIWWQPIIGMTVYSFNHWLVAIGLSLHAASVRWWLFAPGALVLGAVGLLLLTPSRTARF